MTDNNQNTLNDTSLTKKDKTKPSSIISTRGILLIVSSNLLGKTFIVGKDKSVIGRNQDCEIVINDDSVSKRHCAIYEKDNKFFIEDLGSTNSTFVNGKLIKKKTHIIFGDRIILGNTILRFYLEEKIE